MEKQLATGFANAISSSFSPYASLWPDRLAWQLQWAARRLDSLAHPKISKTIGRPNVLKKGVVQGLCGGCAGISELGDPSGSAGFIF